ncbi:MAG: Hsp33 family molecular chaperone HslO [Oscillospiraceae bacterium]|nr:Hsp33 family molecular chaperone HslO [Oscillospiraceae bacterium]
MGNLLRTITQDGSLVCTVLDGTEIARRSEQIHQTSAVVTAALGRLLIAASMIGAGMKNETDNVTLRLAGNGPAGTLIAVSDSKGCARGYVQNSIVEIPLNCHGKLDVSGAVGKEGTLTVLRDMGYETPVTGTVPITSGEIAEDITYYYANSEQIPTVCALGVLVDTDLSVKAAGGYLIQLLPGAGEDIISRLEHNLKGIPPVSSMVDEGLTPLKITERLLAGFSFDTLDEQQAIYRCDCSKERVERALISLGREELKKLMEEQETTEVCCHFCNNKYVFSRKDLERLLQPKK